MTSNINGTCDGIVDLTLSHTWLLVATFNLNLITSCPRSFSRCSTAPPPQPLLYTMRYWLHVHICIFWPKDEYRGMSGWYARIDSLHRDNYSDVNPHPFPASLPQPLLSTHLQAAIPSTFQFFCHFSPFTLLNSS